MLNHANKKGFSLIELMITLTLSSVVMLGIGKVYFSFLKSGLDNLQYVSLQQDLVSSMSSISRELHRASSDISSSTTAWDTTRVLKLNILGKFAILRTLGFPSSFKFMKKQHHGLVIGVGPEYGNGRVQLVWEIGTGLLAKGNVLAEFKNLPANGKIQQGKWFIANSDLLQQNYNTRVLSLGTCVLYAYDANKNSQIDTDDLSNERFGFRLNVTNGLGKIQKRVGGDFSDCSTGNWEDLSDGKRINITSLNFVLSNTDVPGDSGGTISRQHIVATIIGHLLSDKTVSKTLTRTIQIRNDQYVGS